MNDLLVRDRIDHAGCSVQCFERGVLVARLDRFAYRLDRSAQPRALRGIVRVANGGLSGPVAGLFAIGHKIRVSRCFLQQRSLSVCCEGAAL